MADITKKYNLPSLLDDADDEVKEMVIKGALRTYVNNFYHFGRPIIAKMYKIDKGEQGQRYMSSLIFNEFAGDKASLFKEIKPSKYRNLSLINLAFYCNYLQGIFYDLVTYHKSNPNVNINTFEKRVKEYAKFMRSWRIKPNIYVDKSMASVTDYKESLKIYERYSILNSSKIQELINEDLKNRIFSHPEMFDMPFVIDLDQLRNNNYFDKRKDQYFNYSRYPKEIEKMEEFYKEYLFNKGVSLNNPSKKDWRELSSEELINLEEKNYDEDYVIYDELEML